MATSRDRIYRQLPPETPFKLREELRLIWDAIYDLRDGAKSDVRVYKLTRSGWIDFDTFKGKPIIVILFQDGTGGWIPVFSPKFKGINTVIWDTAPNTYTVLYMYPQEDAQVLCIAGVTGGSLA